MNIKLNKTTSLVFVINKGLIQISIVRLTNNGYGLSIYHLLSTAAMLELLFGKVKIHYEIIEEHPFDKFATINGVQKIYSFIAELVYEVSFRERSAFFKQRERKYRLKVFNDEINDFEYMFPFGYGFPPKTKPFDASLLSTIVNTAINVLYNLKELSESLQGLKETVKHEH